MRDFCLSTKDYHVQALFYSTEQAYLPFEIKSAMGRYFISRKEPGYFFPFQVGDEIIEVDGEPIDALIQRIKKEEIGENSPKTDQALAEIAFTQRSGVLGNKVPKGFISLKGKKARDGRPFKVTVPWQWTPEKIPDPFLKTRQVVRGENGSEESFFLQKAPAFSLPNPLLQTPLYLGPTQSADHILGSLQAFLPPLGKILWQEKGKFHAYIFETPSGEEIGYIRIPHFGGNIEEVEAFGRIMNIFERRTKGLVLDQMNNPGGSLFYLYGLASIFANEKMAIAKHRVALTQEEIYDAVNALPYLEEISTLRDVHQVIGEEIGGFPVNVHFARQMAQFFRFIIQEWKNGKFVTDPTHLMGLDYVFSHPHYRYTKPILLLINALDFSGGDFFPAIMQDNQRARLMGSKTAGAGGFVLGTQFPNRCGLQSIAVTGSVASREDSSSLENLGVEPDIPYELTVEDLQNGYQHFANEIVENIEEMIK